MACMAYVRRQFVDVFFSQGNLVKRTIDPVGFKKGMDSILSFGMFEDGLDNWSI